jgi:hypothetical protein
MGFAAIYRLLSIPAHFRVTPIVSLEETIKNKKHGLDNRPARVSFILQDNYGPLTVSKPAELH